MKKKLLNSADKFILLLLAILGIASCEPMVEYGTPHADYELKGIITDSLTGVPINKISIKVIDSVSVMQDNTLHGYGFNVGDTETNSLGRYDITVQKNIPVDSVTFYLKVEDMDSTANGGEYISKKVSVNIHKSELSGSGAGNWSMGKAIKTIDIKLQSKK
jgi:putative lipoprotein (rSAM/lipoprotein system)